MTAYLAITTARFRTLLQYRSAALAGFGTQLFWGLIRVMIFDAFFRSSTAPQPMSPSQVVTYVWLGQAMLNVLPWSLDTEVRTMIRSGTVAYELLRPLDLYSLWFSRALAQRTAPTLLRAVPLFLVAGLFFGLGPPPSAASGAAWGATTLGAVLLASAMTTLITISLLWTLSGEGVARLMPTLVYAFSGMIVPLPFFPSWAQALLDFLPFRGMADVPYRAYSGHLSPEAALPALAHQLGWTIALVVLGRWLLGRAARRLVIQGG